MLVGAVADPARFDGRDGRRVRRVDGDPSGGPVARRSGDRDGDSRPRRARRLTRASAVAMARDRRGGSGRRARRRIFRVAVGEDAGVHRTDTVLIADFANSTGDPVFDDALRQAVAVQLQQTPFLTLLPDQRIQRTLRLMQRHRMSRSSARSRAKSASARAPRRPSKDRSRRSDRTTSSTSSVHNCQTGESLAQQQVQAASKEDVLSRARRRGDGAARAPRRVAGVDPEVRRAGHRSDDDVARSAAGLRPGAQDARDQGRRGVDSVLPAGVERDPNFALGLRQARRRLRQPGRHGGSEDYALKAYEFATGQRVRAALHQLEPRLAGARGSEGREGVARAADRGVPARLRGAEQPRRLLQRPRRVRRGAESSTRRRRRSRPTSRARSRTPPTLHLRSDATTKPRARRAVLAMRPDRGAGHRRAGRRR